MLLELAQWLAKDFRLFNVFNYITLRAVLACLTALAISLIAGPVVIRKLTAYKIGQAIRDDGPQTHLRVRIVGAPSHAVECGTGVDEMDEVARTDLIVSDDVLHPDGEHRVLALRQVDVYHVATNVARDPARGLVRCGHDETHLVLPS